MYDAMGPGAILCGLTPWTEASYFHKLGPRSHVSRATKPWTTVLCCTHGTGDRGIMLLCLEPQRAALQKRLFCEIFLRTGYFVLKFAIKVNFVKIVTLYKLLLSDANTCSDF
jgi:hypothetical protein